MIVPCGDGVAEVDDAHAMRGAYAAESSCRRKFLGYTDAMPVTRLNHAVLYVRDVERSRAFYRDVLGFRDDDGDPRPGRLPPGRRARPTTTTSGCSRSARAPGPPRPAGAPSACTTWPGRSTRSPSWPASATRCSEAGALVGASDHGTTKALYAQDPDGLEFEVSWLLPADLITPEVVEARARPIAPAGPRPARSRATAPQTRGGVGVSIPAVH